MGIAYQVTLSRTGDVYVNTHLVPGVAAGTPSITVASGSVVVGWLLQQNTPTVDELNTFLSGTSVTIGAGAKYGGSVTWIPGAAPDQPNAALEAGFFTPQVGGVVIDSRRFGRLPISW
jgi:hypothetical protein